MSAKKIVPDGELYTYGYFFLDYVCRLCWGSDADVELSSLTSNSGESNVLKDYTIAEKIQECTGIDVTTHSHLKKVCSKCLHEIEMFTEFKLFCQETDKKLHCILQKGSTHNNLQSAEEENKSKSDEFVVKQESDIDFSNLDLDDSFNDFLDDLPLSCEIKNLERPVRKRRMKQAYYCNFCRLNLESNEKLTQHNLECHGIEENGVFKCFGCEKRFNNVKKRLRHETDTCKELKYGYKCGICEKYLPKRRCYEHHIRAHKDNEEVELPVDIYKCGKCMKSFENAKCFREHRLVHCQKEKKSYVCDTCGRVFSRRDYLYKHKLVHEGSKLQKCPHCDYRAVQKTSLTVHIRKHTGERPYACDICPHRCVTSSNLRAHRKRHFGIKAFECKLCDKKFGYKLSLDEHTSSVHSQPESHSCTTCGATYSRFRGLRRHLLAKHGKKVKKVKNDLVELQNNQEKIINEENNQDNNSKIANYNEKMVIGDLDPKNYHIIQIQNAEMINEIATQNEQMNRQIQNAKMMIGNDEIHRRIENGKMTTDDITSTKSDHYQNSLVLNQELTKNGAIESQNRSTIQKIQIEQGTKMQNNEIAQSGLKDAKMSKTVILDDKNITVLRTADGAIYMTSHIIV